MGVIQGHIETGAEKQDLRLHLLWESGVRGGCQGVLPTLFCEIDQELYILEGRPA